MIKNLQFLPVSWQDLHNSCFEAAKKIIKKEIKFSRIIAISRGGLVVSRILSDFLELPISCFTIVAYAGINNKKRARIVEDLKIGIADETILLVDEVADSGETFILALNYLKKYKPKKVYTIAPFIKPWTKFKPDFWQEKTRSWIIFPYDVYETVNQLKNKVSDNQIIKLGLAKKQVDYFLNII